MIISDYFTKTESAIYSCPWLTSVNFNSEMISADVGHFKADLSFHDHSRLFLFEFIMIEMGRAYIEKYRYHYEDSKRKLIFRWDNAPHFPKLKTFPHHFHIGNKVRESFQPVIQEVLRQVVHHIETKQ